MRSLLAACLVAVVTAAPDAASPPPSWDPTVFPFQNEDHHESNCAKLQCTESNMREAIAKANGEALDCWGGSSCTKWGCEYPTGNPFEDSAAAAADINLHDWCYTSLYDRVNPVDYAATNYEVMMCCEEFDLTQWSLRRRRSGNFVTDDFWLIPASTKVKTVADEAIEAVAPKSVHQEWRLKYKAIKAKASQDKAGPDRALKELTKLSRQSDRELQGNRELQGSDPGTALQDIALQEGSELQREIIEPDKAMHCPGAMDDSSDSADSEWDKDSDSDKCGKYVDCHDSWELRSAILKTFDDAPSMTNYFPMAMCGKSGTADSDCRNLPVHGIPSQAFGTRVEGLCEEGVSNRDNAMLMISFARNDGWLHCCEDHWNLHYKEMTGANWRERILGLW